MELFKAEERTVRQILGKKETAYNIPRNQRDYVWEEKQWKEFLIDINDCIEFEDGVIVNKDYFIGSCVLAKDKKNVESIVDGQQRLTTITIIISVLYDIFKELDQKQLLEGLYSYLYKKNDDGEEYFTIKNNSIEPYYSESILYKGKDKDKISPSNEQEKRINECYNFYYSNLTAKSKEYETPVYIEYLKAFRVQLLDLKLIEISVNNEFDGYTIFEILNAKGKQLEVGDRMKNWILKKLPKTFPSDQAKIKWDKIRSNIEKVSKSDNSFSSFISHYWISTYEKLKDDDEIYHYFKVNVTKEKMVSFLSDLEIFSQFYLKITKAVKKEITTELDFILHSFLLFRTSQVRPIILSLFYNYNKATITEKELIKYLRKIENFHFVFSAICSTPANRVEKIYHNYAPKIKNNYSKKLLEEFFKELAAKKPDYEIFKRNFIIKGFSNKSKELSRNRNLMNYILQRIEYYKLNNSELIINDITIEHILSDDGTDTTAQLGNLLPLSKKINENCGNETFEEKIKKYKNSNYKTVADFIERNSNKTDWTEADIKERTERLAKLSFEKIWEIN
jgi:uncharacterized protein with ParB-like and HNH nuclease domain